MQGVQEMRTTWLTILFVIVVSLPYSEPVTMAVAQNSPPCDEAVLPATVTELLKEKFPQWRPKQVSDIDADNRQLWLEGPNAEACPGVAIGHFESATSLSYAFLLVPRLDPNGGHKLVIVSKELNKDSYVSTLLDHAEGQTFSGLVISKAEPGKYKDWEGKKSVQIRTDALYVEWIGKGAQLYYWFADRYHKLQVSD
jgi:hypothetical protein